MLSLPSINLIYVYVSDLFRFLAACGRLLWGELDAKYFNTLFVGILFFARACGY
jgi:hypothetical protein